MRFKKSIQNEETTQNIYSNETLILLIMMKSKIKTSLRSTDGAVIYRELCLDVRIRDASTKLCRYALSDLKIFFATGTQQLHNMVPSRGLRWSSQTISIGRWRIEAFSTRQVRVYL
jgi:hypothetical protein